MGIIRPEENVRSVIKEGEVAIFNANGPLERMPEETTLLDLSELFKVLGDSTRIKILFALFEMPLSVWQLVESLKMSQPAISHHLKVLRTNKLVKTEKRGKQVIYSLADYHVSQILDIAVRHVEEDEDLGFDCPDENEEWDDQ